MKRMTDKDRLKLNAYLKDKPEAYLDHELFMSMLNLYPLSLQKLYLKNGITHGSKILKSIKLHYPNKLEKLDGK